MPSLEKVKILRYFALASNSSISNRSPVMLANRDEIAIVVFLNERQGANEGLILYDSKTADCLFSHGISKYPSVHPDFLSKNSELMIDVSAKCSNHQSELIMRKRNRMVVVRSKSPFYLHNRNPGEALADFKSEVLFSLVIVISARM